MYRFNMPITRLVIVSVISMFIISVIALFVFNLGDTSQSVTISKVPKDTRVFIDNKEVRGSKTNLPNGKYEVTGEKDGFEEFKETIMIDDFNRLVVVSLLPSSDEAKKWFEENNDLYLEQEKLVSEQASTSTENISTVNPVIAVLPIDGYTYKIGYVLDQTDTSGRSIIVTIDTSNGYRNAAIGAIYKAGFDPAELSINFIDYKNPFREDDL